jgi:hypothetical protein
VCSREQWRFADEGQQQIAALLRMDWLYMAQDRKQNRAVAKIEMNFQISENTWHYLTG